jgi:hypothetical protein
MDYSISGTHLHKHQWDLVHDPVGAMGLWDGDGDVSAKSLLSSKYVFTHFQLSTKAYASKKGQDEFTQPAIDEVDSKLYQLDTAGVKTYIYFSYVWFHEKNIGSFDKIVDNAFSHAYDSIIQHLGIKDFNLLAIVNTKYDTALSNGVKTVAFREKFYAMGGLSKDCTKAINDYLLSPQKKTFVNGLDEALKERAEILFNRLKNCESKSPNIISFTNINASAKKAVDDVLTFKKEDDPACNLCTRAALLNSKNDPVLFPKKGSYVFFTYGESDPVIKGEISGEGSATEIVNDFQNYEQNSLREYFVEESKLASETHEQFWKRLQDTADNGEVIIGIYKPKHVFMIVPGGMVKVVNNVGHTTDWELDNEYKDDPIIEEGDKYGFCFALKDIEYVPRILECGANVKSHSSPIYANMDYKGVTNVKVANNLRWFRYIK